MAVLPGVRTVIEDRFYTLTRADTATGPRIAVIARRDTASGTTDSRGVAVYDYDPYFAASEKEVITVFGEGSHAHRAYLETAAGTGSRIYIIATPAGTLDSALTNTADDSIFDQAFNAVEQIRADFVVPYGRGSGPEDWDDYATPATPGTSQFGFCADNSASAGTSLAKLVADRVQVITERTHPLLAVMGVKPYVGNTDFATGSFTNGNLNTHITFPNLIDNDGATIGDNGSYVIVVATELRPIGYPAEFGFSNGACMLAGYIANLDSWRAPTGKTIYNLDRRGLRYAPNRVQAEAMLDKGVVPVMLDFTNAAVWVDGRTFGKDTSDYVRVTTKRIVFDVVKGVRIQAQKFIGEVASFANRTAMETGISSVLRQFQQIGALLGSDFAVTYIPRENKAVIDLVLQPAFELRNIEITVSVQL